MKMNKKNILISFFLSFLFSSFLNSQSFQEGSFITIIKTSDSIFVAGDSKINFMQNKSNFDFLSLSPLLLSDYYCKIGFKNNIGFAVAGVLKNDELNFDLTSYCKLACEKSRHFFEAAFHFKKIIKNPMLKLWNNIINENYINIKKFTFEVAFMGFYDEIPFVIHLRYVPNSQFIINNEYELEIFRTNPGKYDSTEVYFLGIKQDMINNLPQRIERGYGSYLDVAKHYVQKSIELFPKVCGVPINTFIITNNSVDWVDLYGVCDE